MADWKNKNLRNMEVTAGSGTDVNDTQMLKGEGKFSTAQNDTNEQKQYEKSGSGFDGPYGGKPSGK
jgi:hypothetical protein